MSLLLGGVQKRSYSTVLRLNTENLNNKYDKTEFYQWLAGLIDGDGHFDLTKKGYASLKIIMPTRDKAALYEIKHKYGGSIKSMSGSNAFKYKLSNKKGMVNLINGINGLIRNPTRLLQLNKLCVKYGIKLKEPLPLSYNNGWFSGFVDSDGSIHIDEQAGQLSISVTQKNKYLLDPLQKLYGGNIYILSPKVEAFKYTIFKKEEILKLVDDYFVKYPLKTGKAHRINLIKTFYLLMNYRNLDVNQIDKFNQWFIFKNKWDRI